MNQIGKLTTFYRLLCEEKSIVIPKVQRDFAYGRQDNRTRDILYGILDKIRNAVSEGTHEVLDFVYGASYASTSDSHTGMIPLDGQQRLTVLFLLHFYGSLSQEKETGTPIEIEPLLNFRYETRTSANDFCRDLLTIIRPELIKDYDDSGIASAIRNSPRFSPAYEADPTIKSMLNVLDAIEERFNGIDALWDKLCKGDYPAFYHLTIDRMGLTDDLYIKMNSRGKKLTEFELFKSELNAAIRKNNTTYASRLIFKIDTRWMDMVWAHFNAKPKETDRGYMQLIRNILRLVCILTDKAVPANDKDALDGVSSDLDKLHLFEQLLDTMHSVFADKGGFAKRWQEFTYNCGSVVGETAADTESRVRMFHLQASPFELAMEKTLTVPETIYFYAVYLIESLTLSDDDAKKGLRLVRNLVAANRRAHDMHTPHLPTFLDGTYVMIAQRTLPAAKPFAGPAVEEEILKQKRFNTDEYASLLHYENHRVLYASLSLFLAVYNDYPSLIEALRHFESIFDNNCMSNDSFERIRVSMLSPDTDYWQTRNETFVKPTVSNNVIRYFLHKPDDYQDFFYCNRERYNQEAILAITDRLARHGLKYNDTAAAQFSYSDWRYYMARYNNANWQWSGYGCYAWRDYTSAPLEVYILNSSLFGENNLAWSMMLNIVHNNIPSEWPRTWDAHQQPIEFTDVLFMLDFHQNGWVLRPLSADATERIDSAIDALALKASTEDDGSRVVSHSTEKDYIASCISLLEKIMQG